MGILVKNTNICGYISENTTITKNLNCYRPTESALAADGVCAWAKAIAAAMARGVTAEELRTRTQESFDVMVEEIGKVDFWGVSGHVWWKPGSADRNGDAVVHQLQDNKWVEIARILDGTWTNTVDPVCCKN